MSIVTDVDFSWSSVVTLNADEIWQARGDVAYLSTTASPTENDGLRTQSGETIRQTVGTQIRYLKEGPDPVTIVREVV